MAASEKRIRQILKSLTVPTLELLSKTKLAPMEDLRGVLSSANIVGVGIAKKRTNGEAVGPLALTFYVREKVEKKQLSADEFVPPSLPAVLSGSQVIPTDVVVLGELRPDTNVVRNPVQPGNSIGHPAAEPGTFGAVVTDGHVFMVLSNSHVLARSGLASPGEPILYPGPAPDGGTLATDIVGELIRFVPFQPGGAFVNLVDAAIGSLAPAALQRLQVELRTLQVRPTGTVLAHRDMVVEKVGRTTDLTSGEVLDADFHCAVPYPEVGILGFANQVLCTPYTDGGDSGALVLESGTHKAVGLHVGSAEGGSFFSPISPVLSALGVTLVF
ncbi:MAG TPA: hypothetical protein VF173_10400 [Thermoanaerobaculia bacterium]|nr:hypothetical protein [Thermoanaerobaculia bacterium]